MEAAGVKVGLVVTGRKERGSWGSRSSVAPKVRTVLRDEEALSRAQGS